MISVPAAGELWHDRYRLLRSLGGGASAVFAATDEHSGEDVVLKILRPDLLHSDSAFCAWLTDARVRARLIGPVPRLRDLRFAPLPYSVSDFVTGETLIERLRREGLLKDDAAASLALEAGGILEALGSVGVGAADLDPTNWLLTKDGARYIDFGDVELSVDLAARARGRVDLPALRRRLGELLFAAATGRDASGPWSEHLRDAGVVMPPRAKAIPPIETLLAGEALGPPAVSFTVRQLPTPLPLDVVNLPRPADPLAIDALCAALAARGDEVLRLSPVSQVSALGLTHVSKARQWFQLQALTGARAFVVVEDLAYADPETQAVLRDSAASVTRVTIT